MELIENLDIHGSIYHLSVYIFKELAHVIIRLISLKSAGHSRRLEIQRKVDIATLNPKTV